MKLRPLNDKLPSGEPVNSGEVAGVGLLNLGQDDELRKEAVLHDRLDDKLASGELKQPRKFIDGWFLQAMKARSKWNPWLRANAYARYAIVRIWSKFKEGKGGIE